MTPREKAEAVVVAGMPAGDGFGGVLVRQWNTDARAAARALVFADQEGGTVKTFRSLAPWRAASQYRSAAEAHAAGRETARGAAPGRRPRRVRARARPRRTGRSARATSPGRSSASRSRVGSAEPPASSTFRDSARRRVSTDEARVYGVLRTQDLAPFRAAIRAGVPCVMVGHAIYPRLGAAPRLVRAGRRTSCCGGSASAASRSPTRSASSAAPTRRSGRGSRSGPAPTSC